MRFARRDELDPRRLLGVVTRGLPRLRASIVLIFNPVPIQAGLITTTASAYSSWRLSLCPRKVTFFESLPSKRLAECGRRRAISRPGPAGALSAIRNLESGRDPSIFYAVVAADVKSATFVGSAMRRTDTIPKNRP